MYFEDRDEYFAHRKWLNRDDIDPLEDEKYDSWKDEQAK